MKSLQSRWLTALATVPPVLLTLVTVGPLSVQAAAAGSATSSTSGLNSSQRFELGVAMVALGLLVLAITVIRLRMQGRRRRSPALLGASSWRKVTDTWDDFAPAPRRRQSAASRW